MRVALLISGRGSTAETIINACRPSVIASEARQSRLEGVTPVCVISSRANAGGVERVQAAGIPKDKVYVVSPSPFKKGSTAGGGEEFGEALLKIFKENHVDFIGQYGWMVKTPANVIEKYRNMMVNQHNGPLDPPRLGETGPGRPDFGGEGMYGLRISCARLLFVRKTNHDFWTEATAQRVEPLFDQGAVLKTARLDILETDTPETLSARLLPLEHQVQIAALQDFVSGTVTEIHREKPLVSPDEIKILEEVKKEAIMRYPKG